MTGSLTVITGASSGIGRAAALRLAERHRPLALLALPSSALQKTAKQCRDLGSQATPFPLDVSDSAAVEAAFHGAGQTAPIGGVFHAAGTSQVNSVTATTDEQWLAQLQANLTGTFFVARAAARQMMPHGGGSIVLTGSELARVGQAGYVAYSATKGGIVAMARALASELASSGIRVNVVSPGAVDTPLLKAEFAYAGDPARERFQTEQSIALGRIGCAAEIAAAADFLLSDASSYMTGSELVVDGGRSSCLVPSP
jgi:NAD(P)-dependent dehydrogenase (short-subunit alcohol dehydrogenase family)